MGFSGPLIFYVNRLQREFVFGGGICLQEFAFASSRGIRSFVFGIRLWNSSSSAAGKVEPPSAATMLYGAIFDMCFFSVLDILFISVSLFLCFSASLLLHFSASLLLIHCSASLYFCCSAFLLFSALASRT